MKVYRFRAFDSLDDLSLDEEDKPLPQRGEVLLRVETVALNHRDVALVSGNFQRVSRAGLVPTSDAAAVVEGVGEGVGTWKIGDRVIGAYHPRWFGGPMPHDVTAEDYGSGRDGWLAEFKVVSQEAIVAIPDPLSTVDASTLPCAALTAWMSLTGANPVGPGRSVLTLGTGGVSIFAIQLAKALGARVFVTTTSPRKASMLREMGADEVIDTSCDDDWGRRVRDLSGGAGVDRVIEVGGPATIGQSLEAIAPGGEIALIGYLSKDDPGIDFFALRNSGATIRPIFNGSRSDLADLVRFVGATGLKPVIDRTFAFADARTAFRHLQAGGHVGKIVITVGD